MRIPAERELQWAAAATQNALSQKDPRLVWGMVSRLVPEDPQDPGWVFRGGVSLCKSKKGFVGEEEDFVGDR